MAVLAELLGIRRETAVNPDEIDRAINIWFGLSPTLPGGGRLARTHFKHGSSEGDVLGVRGKNEQVPLHQIAHDGDKGLPIGILSVLIRIATIRGDDTFIFGVYIRNRSDFTGVTFLEDTNGIRSAIVLEDNRRIRLATKGEVQAANDTLQRGLPPRRNFS